MKTFKEVRDYKAEYKKFQSSPERIKYRAELVKYNRDKGTFYIHLYNLFHQTFV